MSYNFHPKGWKCSVNCFMRMCASSFTTVQIFRTTTCIKNFSVKVFKPSKQDLEGFHSAEEKENCDRLN